MTPEEMHDRIDQARHLGLDDVLEEVIHRIAEILEGLPEEERAKSPYRLSEVTRGLPSKVRFKCRKILVVYIFERAAARGRTPIDVYF